jgi:ferrous-iron efflux pump FieF
MSDPSIGSPEEVRLKRRATHVSVAVGVTLALAKLAAWLITGSVTILSSLLDSMVDVIASAITMMTVSHSLRPPDRSHRFGHGKAEPLGALAQAAFIGGSGLFIVFQAIDRFLDPKPPTGTSVGLAIMGVSILLTLGLVTYQHHVVRRTGSLAIAADRLHYSGDLLTNLAVVAALGLFEYTGALWLDPLVGIAIAGYLLANAAGIGRGAVDVLMDRELPAEDRRRIKEIVLAHDQVEGLHDLRTRSSGTTPIIALHLEVDGELTVNQAHDISDAVEISLRKAFPGAQITLHQEPAGLDDDRLDHIIHKKHRT